MHCECSRPPRVGRTTLVGMTTTRTRIRFGIVGTGGIANTHAAGLAALGDDAELVACCDVDPTRVADFSERWGVQHQFTSARAMLDAVDPASQLSGNTGERDGIHLSGAGNRDQGAP